MQMIFILLGLLLAIAFYGGLIWLLCRLLSTNHLTDDEHEHTH